MVSLSNGPFIEKGKLSMNSKSEIRRAFIKKREAISKERREKASLAAEEKLLERLSTYSHILSFASKKEEINLSPLNEILAKEGRLLLPRLISETKMAPFQVKAPDQQLILHPKWKVFEPDPKQCPKISLEKIDCVIVPGIAFDQGHGRLGCGKGHYDRFLAQVSCPTIGVGFKEQILETPFPHENHDIPLTEIYLF